MEGIQSHISGIDAFDGSFFGHRVVEIVNYSELRAVEGCMNTAFLKISRAALSLLLGDDRLASIQACRMEYDKQDLFLSPSSWSVVFGSDTACEFFSAFSRRFASLGYWDDVLFMDSRNKSRNALPSILFFLVSCTRSRSSVGK